MESERVVGRLLSHARQPEGFNPPVHVAQSSSNFDTVLDWNDEDWQFSSVDFYQILDEQNVDLNERL